jgi:hypothetical protein
MKGKITARQKTRLASIHSGFNGEKHNNRLIGILKKNNKEFPFGIVSPENSRVLRIVAKLTMTRKPHKPPFWITRTTTAAKIMALTTLFQNIFWILDSGN